MLIEIHTIQNYAPANMNSDDLKAPKTCYFGGVLRSRISSQCLKRSIRKSEQFAKLCGGIRTRRLMNLIEEEVTPLSKEQKELLDKALIECGLKTKTKAKKNENNADEESKEKLAIFTTYEAIREIGEKLRSEKELTSSDIAQIICNKIFSPDLALCGRMLEPSEKGPWGKLNKTIEASLQVAHAISTHEARPEVDYFVTADDVPGEDAGAAYLDEALYNSSCFYKYFSINWEKLVENLNGNKELAAHTVGAFLQGSALCNPTGKQNSCAAHNPPDGILVIIKKGTPVSFANAFTKPAKNGKDRDLTEQSIAQLAQYAKDIKIGYGKDNETWLWFSPNMRYHLTIENTLIADENINTLASLIEEVILKIGFKWADVQKAIVTTATPKGAKR